MRGEERHLFGWGSFAGFVWMFLYWMIPQRKGKICTVLRRAFMWSRVLQESLRGFPRSPTSVNPRQRCPSHQSDLNQGKVLCNISVVDDTRITSCPLFLSLLWERQSNYSAQLMNCRAEQHLQFHIIQPSFYLSWHKCQTLVCPWTGCWQEPVAEWVMSEILKPVSQHGLPGREQVILGQERKSDVRIYFLSWRGNG